MKNSIKSSFFCSFCLIVSCLSAQFNPQKIEKQIEEVFPQFNVTGMALSIIHDDSVIFSKGFGWRDEEKKLPVTSQSLFNIASCSKAFTAAALAKLQAEQKINWADKVIDYIPEFQLADRCISADLNLIDILTHRSGLGTFYGDLLWYRTDYLPAEIIHRIRFLPITEDFRSSYGYQNNMYLIAGEIIKKVSGQSWADYVKENFFIPLEMYSSFTCSEELEPDTEIAFPHLNGKIQELYIDDPHAAYSIFSNTEDLSHWVRMLLNNGFWKMNRILPEDAILKIFEPQMILPLRRHTRENKTNFRTYGLGWFMFDYAGRKIIEHDGGMPGYISKITLVPDENLGFIILTNDDAINFTSPLRNILLDAFFVIQEEQWFARSIESKTRFEQRLKNRRQERYALRQKDTSPSLALTSFTGIYEDRMYGQASVIMHGDSLFLTLLPTKRWFTSSLQHWHYDTFKIKFKDEYLPEGFVTFHFDTDRAITGFTIDLPNPDFHFFNLNFKRVNEQMKSNN